MDNDIEEILFDQASIHEAAHRLGQQITKEYTDSRHCTICAEGGLPLDS